MPFPRECDEAPVTQIPPVPEIVGQIDGGHAAGAEFAIDGCGAASPPAPDRTRRAFRCANRECDRHYPKRLGIAPTYLGSHANVLCYLTVTFRTCLGSGILPPRFSATSRRTVTKRETGSTSNGWACRLNRQHSLWLVLSRVTRRVGSACCREPRVSTA